MKLFSWNINGIRSAISKGILQKFIEDYSPDILCLQETRAKKGQVEIDLPDYFEYWNGSEKPGYSGTAIFSKIEAKQSIIGFSKEISEKYKLTNDSYGDPDKEGRVLSLEFNNYWVVTVYTPNSKNDLSRLELRHKQWDPAFLEYIRNLEKTKPVLFCGDLNVAHQEIDLAHPKANRGKHGFTDEERAGFDALEKSGFVDIFRAKYPDKTEAYTWWSHWAKARERNVGWRIDYWLVSKSISNIVCEAQIHPEVMGSDHCPISITIKE